MVWGLGGSGIGFSLNLNPKTQFRNEGWGFLKEVVPFCRCSHNKGYLIFGICIYWASSTYGSYDLKVFVMLVSFPPHLSVQVT